MGQGTAQGKTRGIGGGATGRGAVRIRVAEMGTWPSPPGGSDMDKPHGLAEWTRPDARLRKTKTENNTPNRGKNSTHINSRLTRGNMSWGGIGFKNNCKLSCVGFRRHRNMDEIGGALSSLQPPATTLNKKEGFVCKFSAMRAGSEIGQGKMKCVKMHRTLCSCAGARAGDGAIGWDKAHS